MKWYLAHYPDVKDAGFDPIRHYNSSGWTEGRDPHPGFSTNAYLAFYDDVKAAGLNPLKHFASSGLSEGRHPKPQVLARH
jgi:hypothetical protein